MDRSHVLRLLTLLVAGMLVLGLMVGSAAATEDGADTEGGREKVQLPESPRDRVGLVLLGVMGVGALLAADNARRQLKGERRKASGDFRWR